jgi:SAM-dependent methyltransferase
LKDHMSQYEHIVLHLRLSGKRVLDVACGVGLGSRLFADRGSATVIAVDISFEAIRYGREHYPYPEVRYCLGDASELPFPDQAFDAVISLETLEHVPRHQLFLQEVYRMLKAGGVLVISTPNQTITSPKLVPSNPFHVREFSVAELHSLLSRYYPQMEWFGQHLIPRPFANRLAHKLLYMLSRRLIAMGGPNVEAQIYSLGGGFHLSPLTRLRRACFEPRGLMVVCHKAGTPSGSDGAGTPSRSGGN